jgi:hypothetical protein
MSLFSSLLLTTVTASLVLGGCRVERQQSDPITRPQSSPSPSPTPKPADDPGQSVADCIENIPFLETTERTGLLKAWKKVNGYRNYRMVEASDFRIPDWVSRESYAGDVKQATGWSHHYGELNGAYGLALFVLDRKATYPNCFGVAVLIKRTSNKFDLYWIFQQADLTHFNMRRHSGDVYLIEYGYDEKTHSCDLEYSRKQRRWACEL